MINLSTIFPTVVHLVLVAISFCLACGVIALCAWPVWTTARTAIAEGQQMHQIPCANCCFFTHDYGLKCTVHPKSALSVAAIDCPDHRPTTRVGVN